MFYAIFKVADQSFVAYAFPRVAMAREFQSRMDGRMGGGRKMEFIVITRGQRCAMTTLRNNLRGDFIVDFR